MVNVLDGCRTHAGRARPSGAQAHGALHARGRDRQAGGVGHCGLGEQRSHIRTVGPRRAAPRPRAPAGPRQLGHCPLCACSCVQAALNRSLLGPAWGQLPADKSNNNSSNSKSGVRGAGQQAAVQARAAQGLAQAGGVRQLMTWGMGLGKRVMARLGAQAPAAAVQREGGEGQPDGTDSEGEGKQAVQEGGEGQPDESEGGAAGSSRALMLQGPAARVHAARREMLAARAQLVAAQVVQMNGAVVGRGCGHALVDEAAAACKRIRRPRRRITFACLPSSSG